MSHFHIFPLISNLKVKIAFSLLVLLRIIEYYVNNITSFLLLIKLPTVHRYQVTAINTIAAV